MAENYLITGYWGEPHVTAENDRGIHAGIFGAGRFVLPVGEQFRAEYIGNNTVRMYDGKLMNNGAAAGIPAGKYVDLLIQNAGQGMKRNDLIVFQYSLDSSTLIENGNFVVIPGAETSGTASDPALTQGDLLSGKATLDQWAMWRVSISGSTIAAPEKLFTVSDNLADANKNAREAKEQVSSAKKTADDVRTDYDNHAASQENPHGVTKNQIGMGNVPNVSTNDQTPTHTEASALAKLTSGEKLSVAFGKIAKAISDLISHLSNKNNPHGVTAEQAGAVPTTRKVNNKALSADISLTASDVGASPTGHKHTKSEITDFPTSMTPTAHTHTKSQITDFPTTETWTFTLEDGSTVTKVVYVG